MTQEYTPTTDDVREGYSYFSTGYDDTEQQMEQGKAEGRKEFNRWLAAHDAQIRKEALNISTEEALEVFKVLFNSSDIRVVDLIKRAFKAVAEHRKEQQQ